MSAVSPQDEEQRPAETAERRTAERRTHVVFPGRGPGAADLRSPPRPRPQRAPPLRVLLISRHGDAGSGLAARGTRPGSSAGRMPGRLIDTDAGALEITQVRDVPEASDLLRRVPSMDVIVLDGTRAIEALRQVAPGLPVVALVASSQHAAMALEQGAHAFARRPDPGRAGAAQRADLLGGMDPMALHDAIHHAIHAHGLRRERDHARAQLVHADRLASLGQLTAEVAHEINNPTAYLLHNLEAMKDQLSRALASLCPNNGLALRLHELAEIVDESLEGLDQLRSIAGDLRHFSRADADGIDPDGLAPVDLHRVIHTACKLVHNTILGRARLIEDLQPVPRVMGHHGKLVQVFVNLLTNAAHAIDGGAPEDNAIRVCTREQDGVVVAAVEDTGCGIPEQARERVFERFFTTKPRDQGTGLGLSLSANIVRALGGTIELAAHAPRGTRFELRLTTANAAAAAPARERAPRRAPASNAGRARVLLVDDELSMLRAYRRVLAPYHDVTMAASGQQALDIVERDTAFDAVICDFLMPGVDGPMVHQAVARKDPELASRIVFCTGGAVTHQARAFLRATSNTVLEKPVLPEFLLGAIEQLGRRGDG